MTPLNVRQQVSTIKLKELYIVNVVYVSAVIYTILDQLLLSKKDFANIKVI